MRRELFAGSRPGGRLQAGGPALLMALCLVLAGCHEAAKVPVKRPTPVRIAAVEPYVPQANERYSASLVPYSQVAVSPKTGGYVEEILQVRGVDGRSRNAGLGDQVSKGALLARLRARDFNVKVNQASAQVEEVRKTRAALEAQLRQAEAAAQKANLDYERAAKLLESRSIVKPDYDAARAQRDATTAQVEAVRRQIEASSSRIQTAEGSVEEARLAREDSELRAPISGAVLQRNLEEGQLAAPGQAAFVLADISSVKAVFGVPDRDIVKLQRGRRLGLLVEAVPGREFHGIVTALAPAADPSTRLFQVELTLANPDRTLLPGMVVSLSLSTDPTPAKQVQTVPLSAIVGSSSSFAVFVIEQNRVRRKPVTLGETYGNRIGVSGLQAGEKVVATGPALLTEGEEVQVIP